MEYCTYTAISLLAGRNGLSHTTDVRGMELLWIRPMLYHLLFWPVVAVFIYRDTAARGRSDALRHAVGLGALGIAGLMIHLYFRSR